MSLPVCLHFDHIRFKTKCELGQGRIAPRDCLVCSAYDGDTGYRRRSREQDNVRDDAWSALLMQRQAIGV